MKSGGLRRRLRASCWNRRVISFTAISAATSPSMWPPMPSHTVIRSTSRLYEYPMRSSLPLRSPWRLSWKIVNRIFRGLLARAREELGKRLVDGVEERSLLRLRHRGRLLHQHLLQVVRRLRALHPVDGKARVDEVVEAVRVSLSSERAQRDDVVLLLACVARLRRRARDARVQGRAHRVDVAPGPELLGIEAVVLG